MNIVALLAFGRETEGNADLIALLIVGWKIFAIQLDLMLGAVDGFQRFNKSHMTRARELLSAVQHADEIVKAFFVTVFCRHGRFLCSSCFMAGPYQRPLAGVKLIGFVRVSARLDLFSRV